MIMIIKDSMIKGMVAMGSWKQSCDYNEIYKWIEIPTRNNLEDVDMPLNKL